MNKLVLLGLLLLSSCGKVDRFSGYNHIESGPTDAILVVDLKVEYEEPLFSYVEIDFIDIYYNDEWFIVLTGDEEVHLRMEDIAFWVIDY